MAESIREREWRSLMPARIASFTDEMAAWCGCRCCHACCMNSGDPPPVLKMLFAGERRTIPPHLFGRNTGDDDE